MPLILLMMAMLEWGGIRGWLMHLLGAALLVARLLHGYALAFTQKWKFGRYYGALLTYVVLLVTALLCVWRGVVALML